MYDMTAETITRGDLPGFRARLEYDIDPINPLHDWEHPGLNVRVVRGYRNVNEDYYTLEDEDYYTLEDSGTDVLTSLERAWDHLNSDYAMIGEAEPVDAFERYVRLFHPDVTVTQRSLVGSSQGRWVDVVAWGYDDGDPIHTILDEVESVMQGDVYGVIVERETVWTNGDGDTMTTWEEVDDGACWGFVGHEWAVEQAESELARIALDAA